MSSIRLSDAQGRVMEYAGFREAAIFVIVAVLLTALVKRTNKTDIAKIQNLPEIPGVPLFGSLFLLGRHHARNCARLAKDYGDVFQARLGNRVSPPWDSKEHVLTAIKRFIYANSFESVRELWIKNQSALISRPKTWTFHNVVSAPGVFTLGTSPWNDSVKRARKAAATALNRQAVQTYLPIIDLESTTSIKEVLRNLKLDDNIDPNGYFQRFSLNMSLTLNYGIRLDDTDRAHHLLNEVVTVERELANFRGIAHNWQDYIPLLRLRLGLKKQVIQFRGRRDDYILFFFQQLKERIAKATDKPCIAGNVLKDPEAKLSDNELKSICLTMVAAGLDTLPGNINMTIAYLSSEHGQEIQKKLHEELVKAHAGEDPWHACLTEEKSEYMRSFVKEVLRFWSTLNMSFNRESTKPIVYKGATIPAGTPFLMNMWAANHDPEHFSRPMDFYPERFMGVDEAGAGTQHYGYGAGTRMCAGVHLANRELYAIFSRLVLAFHVLPTDDLKSRPILDTIECNSVPTSMVTQPKPFKVKLIPRSEKQLETWIAESFKATEHL